MACGVAFAVAMGASVTRADDNETLSTAYDWTGLYIGAHGGGVWGGAEVASDQFVGPGGPFVSGDFSVSGLTGGALVGHNFQFKNFVFGLEGDASYGDVDGNDTIAGTNYDFEVNISGTVRGRFGYVINELYLYGTAGVAFADVKVSDNTGITGSDRQLNIGFVVGGGLEYAISENLHIRGTYLYTNYGTQENNLPGPAAPGFFDRADFETHTVRAAIIWNFGNVFGYSQDSLFDALYQH